MLLIKNNSPYIGKIRLKFEREPEYTRHFNGVQDILNKVHLNLGFTKLVSRLTTILSEDGRYEKVDSYTKMVIETFTGGRVREYTMPETGGILYNSFLHPDGRYIGDVSVGYWYYKNKFKVTDIKPNGVAVVAITDGAPDSKLTKGFYGYSHRGGCLFQIGDRIFDEKYTGGMSTEELDNRPFTLRGYNIITNSEEAEQAAINFSNYIS